MHSIYHLIKLAVCALESQASGVLLAWQGWSFGVLSVCGIFSSPPFSIIPLPAMPLEVLSLSNGREGCGSCKDQCKSFAVTSD